MASLGRKHREIILPCTRETIDCPQPIISIAPYKSAFREPIEEPLSYRGLRKRIDWAGKVLKTRVFSPNFSLVVQTLRKQCEERTAIMREGSRALATEVTTAKSAILETSIIALDAAVRSRYANEQGPNGLCQALMDSVNAMLEVRMWIEYGDYLSENLEPLAQGRMKDLLWKKIPDCDWQEVKRHIGAEEELLEQWRVLGTLPKPQTLWLDDVTVAATRLGLPTKQTVGEIKAYADRCAASHSGIGDMIDRCQWYELAVRILYDKSTLNAVFRNDTEGLLIIREAIARLTNEWFKKIDRVHGRVVFRLTDKALEKQRARIKRKKNRGKHVVMQTINDWKPGDYACCGRV